MTVSEPSTTSTCVHKVNPETDRCILCGQNRWNRERAEPSRGAPDAQEEALKREWFTKGLIEARRQLNELRSGIPAVLRATGRTIPDLTKREHVCEYQQSVKPRETEHVVLLEALRHALPILIGAIAIVDCRAVVAEVRAAIKQAERT